MFDFVIDVGLILKNLRQSRSETLHRVSKEADIDSPLLSKIERGERLPTDEQLRRLATHFDIRYDELQVQLVAQRILREHGTTADTYRAVKLIEAFLSELLARP